jgi:hypothetical protein
MSRVTLGALLLALLILGSGCPVGDEPALFGITVEAGSATDGPFTTAAGYDVVLETGIVVLGALQFHEPKAVDELALPTPVRWLVGPEVARAHPGHDMSGDVRGELTGTFAIDLLAGPTALGEGSFYEGPYETASLVLHRDGVDGETDLDPSSPVAGHTLYLAGTADDGSGPLPFELLADHDQTILGIPFETELGAETPPTVILLLDPAEILGHLDFVSLDHDGDGTVTLADDGVLNPLRFGLESNLTYTFEIR